MQVEVNIPVPYRRRRRRRQKTRRQDLLGRALLLAGFGMLAAGLAGPFLLFHRHLASASPKPQRQPSRGRAAGGTRPQSGSVASPRTSTGSHPPTPPTLANASGAVATVVWSIPVRRPEVFLTIDDGWFPSQRVLAYMQSHPLPITAFVIGRALQEHPGFWQAFAQAGGSVEDHTFSHPDLTRLSYSGVVAQVGNVFSAIRSVTGQTPLLMRPPYGAFDRTVLEATYAAGVPDVVMWNAEVSSGPQGYGTGLPLRTWNGKPLAPGSIILLHWVPGLYPTLMRLLATIAADHLQVGNLLQHLPLPASTGSHGAVAGKVTE